jgi:hypothetical protein
MKTERAFISALIGFLAFFFPNVNSVDAGWEWENPLPQGNPLHGILVLSSDSVFAVGEVGTILHYDGDTWSQMNSSTSEWLYGIWGSSESDVFAVGYGGTIMHYNGSTWSSMDNGSGYINWLDDVWGSSGSDVFAVGSSGTILHYDGSSWSEMTSGSNSRFAGIWGSSGSDVYAVGGWGSILYYCPGPARPLSTTKIATAVTSTSAILNGTVDPNCSLTTVLFEYGNTTAYGDTINAIQSPVQRGSSVFVNATLTGLAPGGTYHFRVKAANSLGTSYGSDISFTTSYASQRYVCSDGYCGGKTPCHRTISEAVTAASTGTLIKMASEEQNGGFTVTAEKELTIQGGWDKIFNSPNGGTTTLKSAPKAPQGSLTFQNLRIIP